MKVISGAQTGADLAGLEAAKEVGFETGGTMPKGARNQNGPQPHLTAWYGMSIHSSREYSPRTEKNVVDSDATLRIAKTFESGGEKCTLTAIKKHEKPYFDVQVSSVPGALTFHTEPQEIVAWIKEKNIRVLNVAGNSEKTCPGIQVAAKQYLLEVFKLLLN